jgi:hypothetical protein
MHKENNMNAFYTKDHLINEGLITLMEKLANNYDGWIDSIKTRDGKDSDYRDLQAENFRNNLKVELTRKYIKVITDSYVWGFIVRENDSVKCSTSEAYFSRGDILKGIGGLIQKQTFKKYSLGNIIHGNPNNYDKPNPDYPDFKTYWTGAK